jgi:hypothetical protein
VTLEKTLMFDPNRDTFLSEKELASSMKFNTESPEPILMQENTVKALPNLVNSLREREDPRAKGCKMLKLDPKRICENTDKPLLPIRENPRIDS